MLHKATILAVAGLALSAPAALAENVYFSVGIDGRATAGVSLDDWEPKVTRVDLVRGGAVVSSASADTPGLPFAYIRSGTLQAGDVLNVYRDSTLLGAVPYTGLPTVGADACAGRNSFTVTRDEDAAIEDASYYIPGSGGYNNWTRSIWTRTNPATVTIDRPMVQGGVVDIWTWRRITWRGNKRLEINSRREATVPACPVPPPAQPPVVNPGPPAVTDKTPELFTAAFITSSKAFGKRKLSALARKSRFTLSFNAPAKGTVKLRLTAKAKQKTVVLGSGSRSVAAAGTTKVTVKLTKAGRTLLKRSKRLKVTLAGSFTPVGAGAKPIERTTSVTLKK